MVEILIICSWFMELQWLKIQSSVIYWLITTCLEWSLLVKNDMFWDFLTFQSRFPLVLDQKFLYTWSSIFLIFDQDFVYFLTRIFCTYGPGFFLHVDQDFLYIWNCILFIFWSGFCLVLGQDVSINSLSEFSLLFNHNFLNSLMRIFLIFNHNLLYISIRIFIFR